MSRSNPSDNTPNPSTRWFDWQGEKGILAYYDKPQGKNVEVGNRFTFLVLDELSTIRGWHEASKSGIFANEVRDTRQDRFVVKAFKGGTLAEGLYQEIKDRVNVCGGRFHAVIYVAYKNGDGEFKIGAIRFKGAALGAWMEFRKEHRAELYECAIDITGSQEGKHGRVTYHMPTFATRTLSVETNNVAKGLDTQLQTYLKGYFSRTKGEQVAHAPVVDDAPETTDWPNDDAAYMNDEPPY